MLGVAASTEKPTRAGVRDGRAGRLLPLGVSRGVPSLVGRRVLSGVTSRDGRARRCAVAPSLAARSLLSLCASCSAPG